LVALLTAGFLLLARLLKLGFLADFLSRTVLIGFFQHVRHSYKPSVAVKTQTADGNWQMSAVEPGRMATPGLLVYWFGSDLF
jgi:hypothetical protein